MRKLLNVIPSRDGCCVLLYGNIGEYADDGVKAQEFVQDLLEAEAQYGKIDVRINSPGGSLYSGIAMFNVLRDSKADVTIYIDGIAASMASAIAMCGKPVVMSRYGRMMIHNVSSGCYGNKEELEMCLKEIAEFENILAQMYSDKTGMTIAHIKSTYFDGKDHWLTAEEALALGFIDSIYEDETRVEASTPMAIYREICARGDKPIKNEMIEKIKKIRSFAAIANEDDVIKRIGELEAENEQLKAENGSFKKEREEAHATQIATVIEDAQKDGVITAEVKPAYEAMLKADFEAGKKAIAALKKPERAVDHIEDGAPKTVKNAWEERYAEIKENNKKRR